MENHHYEEEGQFQRKMTSRHLFMLSLGGVIGTGLFLSSGYTIAQAGPFGAILSYLVGAIVVYLAQQAREQYWQKLAEAQQAASIYPLISGDVGPYAAYLADGSEYTGQYGKVTLEALKDFHRPRIQLFLEQGVTCSH